MFAVRGARVFSRLAGAWAGQVTNFQGPGKNTKFFQKKGKNYLPKIYLLKARYIDVKVSIEEAPWHALQINKYKLRSISDISSTLNEYFALGRVSKMSENLALIEKKIVEILILK